jgi:hypothetical protein
LCLVRDADPPLVASTVGGRVPSVPALARPLALPPLPACAAAAGVARANSTGVGMRVICDVN